MIAKEQLTEKLKLYVILDRKLVTVYLCLIKRTWP